MTMMMGRAGRLLSVTRICLLCAVLLATAVGCSTPTAKMTSRSTPTAEMTPPKGLVVSSILVDSQQYTADGGRYDLFLQGVPGGKTLRLTDHEARRKLKLGGAIREPVFSHNGKQVMFMADYADSDERRTTMTGAAPYPNSFLNVWVVQLDTRAISPITKGEFGWTVFGWSPDDHYILATCPSRAGSLDESSRIPDDLYVWDVSVRQGRRLVRVPEGIDDAFWYRDGSRIIYQSGLDANLYSVSVKGGKPEIYLSGRAGRFDYSFSPDWKKVAYVSADTVYAANAHGSKPRPAMRLLGGMYDSYRPKPQWSSDGSMLAEGELPNVNARSETKLHVYDMATGKDRVVSTIEGFTTDLTWSRNGRWLIVKTLRAGSADEPDPKTGWHTFHREGLIAVSVSDGRIVILKQMDGETKGLDWLETASR